MRSNSSPKVKHRYEIVTKMSELFAAQTRQERLTDFDVKLKSLTDHLPCARPFVCEGSPLACDVFIVGVNPATNVPFWPFWQPSYGFNKKTWWAAYLHAK